MFQPSRHLFAFSFSMVCSVVVGISCTASTADEVDASAPSNGGVQVDAGAPSNGGVQADAGAPSNGAEPCAPFFDSLRIRSSDNTKRLGSQVGYSQPDSGCMRSP